MASVNNIFLEVSDPPFAKYMKTVPSKLGGVRFDADGKQQVGFIIESNPSGFVYDDEVLEIYSSREDRAVRQYNKALFTKGLLKEYKQDQPPLDMSNMLSDEAVVEIASIRNLQHLTKRISEITSPFTLQRILTAANSIGRPAKTVEAIQTRLTQIQD